MESCSYNLIFALNTYQPIKEQDMKIDYLRVIEIPKFEEGREVGSSKALELILGGFTFLMSKDEAKKFKFFDSQTSIQFGCICFKLSQKEFLVLKNKVAEFVSDT